jgi:hypothetical protein
MKYTEHLRQQLPRLLVQFHIKSLLDLPCGDFHWMQHCVIPEDCSYIGGDIVPALIETNKRLYADSKRDFHVLNMYDSTLPMVDLWFCRDCLFHHPIANNVEAFKKFVQSGIKYIMFSDHYKTETNADIPIGQFSPYNYSIAPFNMPPPLASIEDWIENYPKRRLVLYDVTSIQWWLASKGLLT